MSIKQAGRPAPLSSAALRSIVGVLGEISQQRALDVHDQRAPERGASPRPGRLQAALASARLQPGVIAEIKRASPSQGALADLQPVETAQAYQDAGAVAISVLTEPHRFGGSLEHLEAVAAAVAIPTLMKDFVVHPVQLELARSVGADAVLLIVAVLGERLPEYLAYAEILGLDALVEVHSDAELAVALAAGSKVVGVNNRDLRTLAIDLGLAPELIAHGRALERTQGREVLWVAESGYRLGAELRALRGRADGVLIGSHFALSGDPGAALARLLRDAS